MELCECPRPTVLVTIPNSTCPENIGQIQKFLFQRAGWTFNSEAEPSTDFTILASWTPLLTAAGNTKVVVTPYLEGVVIPPGEAITNGGDDNSTRDGVQQVVGATSPLVTGTFTSIQNAVVEAMKKLGCESRSGTGIVFYGINQWDQLIGRSADAGVNVVGIPLQEMWFSDMGNEGLNTFDKGNFRFSVVDGWRKNLYIVKPDFSPKTQLVVA